MRNVFELGHIVCSIHYLFKNALYSTEVWPPRLCQLKPAPLPVKGKTHIVFCSRVDTTPACRLVFRAQIKEKRHWAQLTETPNDNNKFKNRHPLHMKPPLLLPPLLLKHNELHSCQAHFFQPLRNSVMSSIYLSWETVILLGRWR